MKKDQLAFPQQIYEERVAGIASFTDTDEPGMTLRDYFAAKAINGRFSYGGYKPSLVSDTHSDTAKWAYAVADAMLKEREK